MRGIFFYFQTEAVFFRHMECSAGVDETEVVEIVAICLEFLIKEELKHIKKHCFYGEEVGGGR